MRKSALRILFGCGVALLNGCIPPGEIARPEVPSLAYARQMHAARFEESAIPTPQAAQQAMTQGQMPLQQQIGQQQVAQTPDARGHYHFAKDLPPQQQTQQPDMVTNMPGPSFDSSAAQGGAGYEAQHTTNPHVRPYQGPLHVGEPGASASLWRASGPGNQLVRDHRAFQPMDLVTIVVQEDAEGTKEADTEATKESDILAGITNFFNFETNAEEKNTGLDTSSLINASVDNEFTGEGETTRKGSLRAKIAAIIVEVFPNGVMRIEGEKIISVNNEEQIMIISGLIRPRDVTSKNEVMSSTIANLRIDYFGKGVIGEVQYPGWLGRIIGKVWPF